MSEDVYFSEKASMLPSKVHGTFASLKIEEYSNETLTGYVWDDNIGEFGDDKAIKAKVLRVVIVVENKLLENTLELAYNGELQVMDSDGIAYDYLDSYKNKSVIIPEEYDLDKQGSDKISPQSKVRRVVYFPRCKMTRFCFTTNWYNDVDGSKDSEVYEGPEYLSIEFIDNLSSSSGNKDGFDITHDINRIYIIDKLSEIQNIDIRAKVLDMYTVDSKDIKRIYKTLDNIIQYLSENDKHHQNYIEEKIQTFIEKSQPKKRETISTRIKDKVWNRDGGKCVICDSNENLEFDHIIPVSKGGANTYRNLQLLCEPCNRSKSAKI